MHVEYETGASPEPAATTEHLVMVSPVDDPATVATQRLTERFTNVTQMFLRDRANLAVLGFYVISCVFGVLNAFSVHSGWVPRITLTAVIGLAVVSFAVMAPYFSYVFDFLQPENIISRIRTEAVEAASLGARARSDHERAQLQFRTLHRMEELTDITINSINGTQASAQELAGRGLITYVPFPQKLVGKYQSFTQADMSKLRGAGLDGEFMTVEQGVAAYIAALSQA